MVRSLGRGRGLCGDHARGSAGWHGGAALALATVSSFRTARSAEVVLAHLATGGPSRAWAHRPRNLWTMDRRLAGSFPARVQPASDCLDRPGLFALRGGLRCGRELGHRALIQVSSPRMRRPVNSLQTLRRNVRVDLRRAQVGVTKQRLHAPQIRPRI